MSAATRKIFKRLAFTRTFLDRGLALTVDEIAPAWLRSHSRLRLSIELRVRQQFGAPELIEQRARRVLADYRGRELEEFSVELVIAERHFRIAFARRLKMRKLAAVVRLDLDSRGSLRRVAFRELGIDYD